MKYEIYTSKDPQASDNEYKFRGSVCVFATARLLAQDHQAEGKCVQVRDSVTGAAVLVLSPKRGADEEKN